MCATRRSATSALALLEQVRGCTRCESVLPQPPRPVLQFHPAARILVVGQAPGRRAHEAGRPFDDPSGDRLRHWMGIDSRTFYDAQRVALVPMGFCYPGTGTAGDLPPRPECAAAWRAPLLAQLHRVALTLVMGQYALAWHLPQSRGSLTSVVQAWWQQAREMSDRPESRNTGAAQGVGWPAGQTVPLPHPSPRNNRWLAQHPWFEAEFIPQLRLRVQAALAA